MTRVLVFGEYGADLNKKMNSCRSMEIHRYKNADKLNEILREETFNIIVTSYGMDGKFSGLDVIEHVKKKYQEIPVILTTLDIRPQTIVKAMKCGADDFLPEPFAFSVLEMAIAEVLDKKNKSQRLAYMEKRLSTQLEEGIVAESHEMKDVFEQAAKIASRKNCVLITGESGTGKGVLAKFIHRQSGRADGPFLDINCGAIPQNLIESELFGHEKGAFTGADKTKPGIFELADKGTLFLDEIGTANESFQVRLLKVLEEKKIRRIGGTKDIDVDVRIIVATNLNLPEAVAKGTFRKDLFYRLNMISFCLPALRERKADLPSLIRSFLNSYKAEFGRTSFILPEEMERLLCSYDWPGNIRELKNVIERMFLLLRDSPPDISLLPPEVRCSSGGPQNMSLGKESLSVAATSPARGVLAGYAGEPIDLERLLAESEKQIIEKALEKYRWNKTKTAKALCLKRTTLKNKINKYKIF